MSFEGQTPLEDRYMERRRRGLVFYAVTVVLPIYLGLTIGWGTAIAAYFGMIGANAILGFLLASMFRGRPQASMDATEPVKLAVIGVITYYLAT